MNLQEIPCNVPIVSCIIERLIDGEKHILVQTRHKPGTPYHNTLEIPAGWIEKYENVYVAIKREIKEESGLDVIAIYPKQDMISVGYHNDQAQCFQSFCCQQQLSGYGGLPRVGFCFVVQVEEGEPVFQESETRNPRRISLSTLGDMLGSNPKEFFTLQLSFLLYYFKNNESVKRDNN